MTTWLLTGGAGYIGAHVLRELLASGRSVVVVDDLSTGVRENIPGHVPFVHASIADHDALVEAMHTHHVDGVIHLAAKKAAGESVHQPLYYFDENVGGMQSLLAAMAQASVNHLVYSSSAAVYGTPHTNPVTEAAPLAPESPYGQTKVVGEWLAADEHVARGLNWIGLRYFNVAGAGEDCLGDRSVSNLIPMVFDALQHAQRPKIFGDDYPTPDGTCIRDYVHVADLASAHVAAAARCEAGNCSQVYNVGTGQGASVKDVMSMIAQVIGRDVNAQVIARRPGDPPATVAAIDKIHDELGWHAIRDLREMVTSAWSAWCWTHGGH